MSEVKKTGPFSLDGVIDSIKDLARAIATSARPAAATPPSTPTTEEIAKRAQAFAAAFPNTSTDRGAPTTFIPNLTDLLTAALPLACTSRGNRPAAYSERIPVAVTPIGNYSISDARLSPPIHVAVASSAGKTYLVYAQFDPADIDGSGIFLTELGDDRMISRININPNAQDLNLNPDLAVLNSGQVGAVYTTTRGEGEASQIHLNLPPLTEASVSKTISVVGSEAGAALPVAKLISIGDHFVVVYSDGEKLYASSYDADGKEVTKGQLLSETLAYDFAVTSDTDGHWVVAEMLEENNIKIRRFEGPTIADPSETILGHVGSSAEPGLKAALHVDGRVMLTWKATEDADGIVADGIRGVAIDSTNAVLAPAFWIRQILFANSVSVAAVPTGDFIVGWEESGTYYARPYSGAEDEESAATSLDGFDPIVPTGAFVSDVSTHVSGEGIMTLVYAEDQSQVAEEGEEAPDAGTSPDGEEAAGPSIVLMTRRYRVE